jgi:hypothetical protein
MKTKEFVAGAADTVMKIWRSPVLKPYRLMIAEAKTFSSSLLQPARKDVRKSFVSFALVAGATGILLGGLGTFAMGYCAVTTVTAVASELFLYGAIPSMWGSLVVGSAFTFMCGIASTAGWGMAGGARDAIDTYFAHNSRDIMKTRPPEEIAEAQAAVLRRMNAGSVFRANAGPVMTGAAVTPMKAITLKKGSGAAP